MRSSESLANVLNTTASNHTRGNGSSESDIAIQTFGAVVMVLLDLLALCGNTLVCLSFCVNRRLCNTTGLHILALSLSDLLIAVFVLPFTASALLRTHAGRPRWISSNKRDAACVFQGFFVYTLMAASLQTMALTALNRFLCIVHPILYHKYGKPKIAGSALLAAWGIAALVQAVIIIPGYARYEFIWESALCMMLFKKEYRELGVDDYVACIFVVTMVGIPFVIIIVCYTVIYNHIRKHNSRIGVNNKYRGTTGRIQNHGHTNGRETSPSAAQRVTGSEETNQITANLFHAKKASIEAESHERVATYQANDRGSCNKKSASEDSGIQKSEAVQETPTCQETGFNQIDLGALYSKKECWENVGLKLLAPRKHSAGVREPKGHIIRGESKQNDQEEQDIDDVLRHESKDSVPLQPSECRGHASHREKCENNGRQDLQCGDTRCKISAQYLDSCHAFQHESRGKALSYSKYRCGAPEYNSKCLKKQFITNTEHTATERDNNPCHADYDVRPGKQNHKEELSSSCSKKQILDSANQSQKTNTTAIEVISHEAPRLLPLRTRRPLNNLGVSEVKVTNTLLAVFVGFCVCWLPVVITAVVGQLYSGPGLSRHVPLLVTFFGALSSGINPLIYAATTREFRKTFITILRCGRG